MRIRPLGLAILCTLLGFVGGFLIAHRIDEVDQTSKTQKLLSVEETLQVARAHFRCALVGPEVKEKFNRANPEALPELREMLTRNEEKDNWAGALDLIGRIGTHEDIAAIARFVKSREGNLAYNDPEFRDMERAFYALANMGKRNVSGSRQLLRDMLRPQYWKDAKFTFRGVGAGRGEGFACFMVDQVLGAYSYGEDAEFPRIARAVPTEFVDPEVKAFLSKRVEEHILTHEENLGQREPPRREITKVFDLPVHDYDVLSGVFSPDGKRLYCLVERARAWAEIWRFSLEDDDRPELLFRPYRTPENDVVFLTDLHLSPDGKHLAFAMNMLSEKPFPTDVFVVNTQTGILRNVTGTADISEICCGWAWESQVSIGTWEAEGRILRVTSRDFQSGKTLPQPILLRNLNTGAIPLRCTKGGVTAFFCPPERDPGQSRLGVLNLDAGGADEIAVHPKNAGCLDGGPCFFLPERKVILTRGPVHAISLPDGICTEVSEGTLLAVTSDEGKAVIVSGRGKATPRYYLIDLPQVLTKPPVAEEPAAKLVAPAGQP